MDQSESQEIWKYWLQFYHFCGLGHMSKLLLLHLLNDFIRLCWIMSMFLNA